MGRLNMDDALCAALFASGLRRSDAPATDGVTEAISRTVPVRYPRLRQPDGTGVRRPS